MIVVVIIGLLAAIAIPAFARVQETSRVSAFTNDLRIGRDAFQTYAMENGQWPSDGTGAVPNEMQGYLNLESFAEETPLGGDWDWDAGVFSYAAGLTVRNPSADEDTMLRVDQKIDDGDLSSGDFRSRSGGYILVLEH